MMEMGMSYSGIWLLHIGALGVLDAKLFAKPPAEGERPIGTLVWGIIVLAIAGLTLLSSAWGLIGMLPYLGEMMYNPVPTLLSILGAGVEITLCVFLVLGGISRIRNLAPSKAVLKIILGCCLAGLGLTNFAAQFIFYGYY
jgi:hypothetical protein